MSNSVPVPGQRWMSDTEPELGLGVVLSTGAGRVEILFPAAQERRQYALASAPLRRVAFREGDRIRAHDGSELIVSDVDERNQLLVYKSNGREVAEAELADTMALSTPEDRLLAGRVDPLHVFSLRAEALAVRSRMAHSSVRGYVGGRIDLIPHQLSIAHEVSTRLVPRVLLADEVGLGKTIEAGMILHRLHLTGRADRVLILVPESLVHQWFVELLRRFNLQFSIYDEARCASIERLEEGANPFSESQLILCTVALLAGDAIRARQAAEAGWDVLIVDEAHHLQWSHDGASTEYGVVDLLASTTPGLLLLTATPQQLGPEGHFARLHLLDPDRYSDLDAFAAEAEHYEAVARAIDRVLEGAPVEDLHLDNFTDASGRIARHAMQLAGGDESARARLVADLLDTFGTGRVMFRNTRAALTGFPDRRAELAELPLGNDDSVGIRVKWLARLLKRLRHDKILLICHTRQLAETIHDRLQHEMSVPAALFHEDMTLVQRDRNAAWFSEPDGARILLCSEIGSEGRNFQFAHHLVLFDLPDDPEILEQRIGRLDRIGQTSTVNIHVPYHPGTPSEVLARWYDDGLNAFAENPADPSELARALGRELHDLLERYARSEPDEAALKALIAHSIDERERIARTLQHGYDRLLELNSFRPAVADDVASQIRAVDADGSFESFFLRLLDFFGVHVDEIAPRTYVFRADHLLTDAFPPLPEDGMAATFDRARALSREDLAFITWDHPFVANVLDLLLNSEWGNAAYGVLPGQRDAGLLLEINAIAEVVAPAALQVERYLPPRPIRVVVDQEGDDRTDDEQISGAQLRDGDISRILDRAGAVSTVLRGMLENAMAIAVEQIESDVAAATAAMHRQMGHEIGRLEDLRRVNDNVSSEEIAALRSHEQALAGAIGSARLRLESVRAVRIGS